jgi:hypothetical protein
MPGHLDRHGQTQQSLTRRFRRARKGILHGARCTCLSVCLPAWCPPHLSVCLSACMVPAALVCRRPATREDDESGRAFVRRGPCTCLSACLQVKDEQGNFREQNFAKLLEHFGTVPPADARDERPAKSPRREGGGRGAGRDGSAGGRRVAACV